MRVVVRGKSSLNASFVSLNVVHLCVSYGYVPCLCCFLFFYECL